MIKYVLYGGLGGILLFVVFYFSEMFMASKFYQNFPSSPLCIIPLVIVAVLIKKSHKFSEDC